MQYRLQDLIDIDHFQNLQDRLNKIYSFPSSIIDNDGNILTATAWQDVCTKFHRKNKECERACIKSDQYIKAHLHEANPAVTYRCPHGLVDNATPIIIDEVHYANFFTGQFFLEEPDLDFFRAQAKRYGFDEAAYIEAVKKVPIWTQEQLNSYLFFIKGLIAVISESGLKKLKEIENRKKIAESEKRHKSILKTAMDGFWLADSNGRLLAVNDSYCDMSGYSEEDLLSMRISDLEAVENPENVAAHMQKLMENTSERFESRHRRKDGTLFDVEVSAQFRPEEGGQVVCFLRDITEIKQSRGRIEEALSWYQEVFEGSRDAIFISDEKARFMAVNTAACSLTGFDRKELLRMRIPDLHDAMDRDAFNTYHTRIMAGEAILSEAKIRCKDGEKVDVEFSNKRIVISGQAFMHTTARNISERKRATEKIDMLNQRFTIAADSAGIGVWDLDLESGALFWDDRMYRIYGLEPNGFSGDYASWKQCVHPEDMARADEAVQQAVRHFKPFDTVFRILRPNGEIRHIKANARVINDHRGRAVKMTGVNIDITEQQLSEAALRESQTKFSTLVDQAPAALFLHDIEGCIVDVNQAAVQGYGYSREQLLKMKAKDIDPDYVEREDHGAFWRKLEIQRKVNFQARHSRKDGSVFPVSVSLSPIVLGGEKHIFALAIDMTENMRQKAEIEMQAMVLDQIHDLVVIADMEGGITFVNQAAATSLGSSKNDLVGQTTDILGGNSKTGWTQQEIFSATKQAGKWRGEVPNVDTNGRERVFDCRTQVIYDQDGRPTALFGIASDATENRHLLEKLRVSEARYRKLVNTSPFGIQLTDGKGKIVFSNPAHHKIQGYRDGELIGKYIWDLMADETRRAKAQETYRQILAERPVPKVYFNKDRTGDGREIDVQVNWDYIYDAEGRVEGIISIISDITNQKVLESKLQQAQKMESLGNLAGGIAHDFNNILYPIIGMSEMLMEDFAPESPEHENALEIFKAGKRGRDLVQQILAFSRQSEHKMIPTRIQSVLKEVIKLATHSIPSYIEINQDIQQDCGMVMADPSQIHQVCLNIITNAFHAVEDTGGTISIRLKETELKDRESTEIALGPGRYAVLSFSDNGHGMSEVLITKIFEPYFTTKEKGKGTGLGLAVVYGIINEHKGEIKVYSEIGRGSTFQIYLPLMEKQHGESILSYEECQKGNERILLVDDEHSIAKLEKQMLERLGYKVTPCLNSVEALEVFKARPNAFDMVISDMTMPNLTGDRLARELTAIRPDIPIIICTGFSERLDQEKATAIGVKGFLMKPILKAEMATMVRTVLDEARGANTRQKNSR